MSQCCISRGGHLICTKAAVGVAPKSVKNRSRGRGRGQPPPVPGRRTPSRTPHGAPLPPAPPQGLYVVWECGFLPNAITFAAGTTYTHGRLPSSAVKPSSSASHAQSAPYLRSHASASGRSRSRPVTRCAVPSITTSVPAFQPLLPVVTATSGECCRLTCFCSPTPVQNAKCPSLQMPTSGVTCGRPSERTVVSQKSSAWVRSASTDSHDCAVAVGSLNRLFICPVVMPLSTSPRPRTHRSSRPDKTLPVTLDRRST